MDKVIKGKNIICFGSENWEYPGFQQTLMRKLASDNKIIYVNSIGTRKLRIQLSQLKIYARKIKATFKAKINPEKNCLVCSAKIIPIVYNNFITQINKALIHRQFLKSLRIHNFEPYILWVGTPTAAFLIEIFKPELVVYHAVDRYSKFSFVDKKRIRIYETQLSKKADVIICTADEIKKDLIKYNDNIYTVSHAVDFDHFHSAFNSDIVPQDIKNIPKPIIGYFGGLFDRINYNLLIKLAIHYPKASLVLIGKKKNGLIDLEHLPNVHIIGFRPFSTLPYYLNQFSVCLIPYKVNELMKGVDPIKLREYLCLGKPVVSVDLPEVRKVNGLLSIAKDEHDFVLKVGEKLNENSSALCKKRIRFAKDSDWANKIEEVSYIILKSIERKQNEPPVLPEVR